MSEVKEAKKSISLAQILGSKDREPVPVEVPEWGGTVYLKAMNAHLARAYSEAVNDPDKKHSSTVLAVQVCLCDEQGNQLVPDDALDEFKQKNWGIIQRLGRQVGRLNGVLSEEETKKVVDEVKKV